jgi:hypothetical protein
VRNFSHHKHGTSRSARCSQDPIQIVAEVRKHAKSPRRGAWPRRGDKRPEAGRVGGAARRSRGGGKAAPYGRKPTGSGTAAGPAAPHPQPGGPSPTHRRGDRAHGRLTGPSDSRQASSHREKSPSRARPRARPRKRGRPLIPIFPGKPPAPIRRTDQTRPGSLRNGIGLM